MQPERSTSKESTPGARNLLKYWIVCGLICLLLTIPGIFIATRGYFNKWKVYAPAPPDAIQVVEGDDYEVKVRTTSGEILGRGYKDEIWISTVLTQNTTRESCDDYPTAFSPLTRSPDNLLDCAAFEGFYAEVSFTVLYGLDQDGYVWVWEVSRSGLEVLVFPIIAAMGGGVGILMGSIIWTVRSMRKKPNIGTWLLAALPFLCLILYVLSRGLPLQRPKNSENHQGEPQVFSALNKLETAEAQWYQSPPATPDPRGPAYDFAAQCKSAQWNDYFDTWECTGNQQAGQVSIEVIQYEDPEQGVQNQAIQIFMPPKQWMVRTRYPLWEIRSGDHFRATLVCPTVVENCSLAFSLFYEVYRNGLTPLGEWELTNDQRSLEINVDLSYFAGRVVSFVWWTSNRAAEPVEHTALWVNPRIEHIP